MNRYPSSEWESDADSRISASTAPSIPANLTLSESSGSLRLDDDQPRRPFPPGDFRNIPVDQPTPPSPSQVRGSNSRSSGKREYRSQMTSPSSSFSDLDQDGPMSPRKGSNDRVYNLPDTGLRGSSSNGSFGRGETTRGRDERDGEKPKASLIQNLNKNRSGLYITDSPVHSEEETEFADEDEYETDQTGKFKTVQWRRRIEKKSNDPQIVEFNCGKTRQLVFRLPFISAKAWTLLIVILLTVITGSANNILYYKISLPLKNYPLFLSLYAAVLNVPLFWIIIGLWLLIDRRYFQSSSLKVVPWKWALLGFFDSLQSILGFLSDSHVKGALQQLLIQLTIPMTMFLSIIWLRRTYSLGQYTGALLIFIAIIVDIWPAFFDPSSDLSSPLFWIFVYTASVVPFAFSTVCKEVLLQPHYRKDKRNEDDEFSSDSVGNFDEYSESLALYNDTYDYPLSENEKFGRSHPNYYKQLRYNSTSVNYDQKKLFGGSPEARGLVTEGVLSPETPSRVVSDLPRAGKNAKKPDENTETHFDLFYLMAVDSSYTLLFTLLFSPINAVPHLGASSSFTGVYVDLYHGMECVLLGQNIEIGDQCSGVWVLLLEYYLFNVGINLCLVYLIKQDSAGFMFLAMTITVPIVNICFSFEWVMGAYATPLSAYDIIALILILFGLSMYRFFTLKTTHRPPVQKGRGLGGPGDTTSNENILNINYDLDDDYGPTFANSTQDRLVVVRINNRSDDSDIYNSDASLADTGADDITDSLPLY